MKVVAYPSDAYGCGSHRIIWPATALQLRGHDVEIVHQSDRALRIFFKGDEEIDHVSIAPDVDVVVLQRVTDRRMLGVITWLRERGVAVVIDVDDDLATIHPSNPAWTFLDPNRARHELDLALRQGRVKPHLTDQAYATLTREYRHSWRNLTEACRRATLVTVSTPALIKRYATYIRDGRNVSHGVVVPNYVPDHYLDVEHEDSDVIGWPAALHSHPNDPGAAGNAIARVVDEGARFVTIGDSKGVDRAFGLRAEPEGGDVTLDEWPHALAQIGIGIAPLADTRFNAAKSWLKPLELSAVGVPWIASPRAEYRRLHALGAGILAERPRDWYRALRSLLDDPQRRLDASLAARDVALNLRLSDHVDVHWEAWTWAYEIQAKDAESAHVAPACGEPRASAV